MDLSWINSSWSALLMSVLTTFGIYISLIIYTRIAGLRSFSKMSSFDFAITVAMGSLLVSTIISRNPSLLPAVVSLAALYSVQMFVACLRGRVPS